MSKLINVAITLVAFMLPVNSYSAESYYRYCSVAGFAQGMDDKLINTMAMQLVVLSGPYDQKCADLFQGGKKLGATFDINKANKYSPDSLKVFDEYMAFKLRINKGILSSAGYQ